MTTIVVTNRKGGVGKTTITVHAAVGLNLRGYRVGIVDTDPQGHIALVLGLEKEDGLYRIMLDKSARLSDVLRVADPIRYAPTGYPVDPENPLYVLPSNIGTAIIPYEQRSPLRFKKVLDDMYRLLKLDYVFVDTGPSSNMFDGSVNVAADGFIYAT
ncbi:MAG TPA: ParA family protein, partial [Phototrophicaceae bacterium]|nr:ParA family protein [Phototrophicaceae bacterium]